MSRLEAVANVVLRVPGVVLLDLLYRWDVQAFAELLRPWQGEPFLWHRHLWNLYYLGHALCIVVLLLPVRSLVKMYLYLLTALLLYVGHQTARDYIHREMEDEFQGALYEHPVVLSRFVTAVTGQIFVSSLCALLMQTRQVWLFSAPLLPLLARLCCLPLQALPMINTFATILTALELLYVVGTNLLVPFQLAALACREMVRMLELYHLVALGAALWSQLSVPVLFLVFWLVLFTLQLSSLLASPGSLLAQQGLVFVVLSSVAECCSTPYSLVGLTFTVSYLALGVLNLCKFYLVGYGAFQPGNVMHRGVTEGVTLLLLALQTGLLDLQILQRTFLLSIILFIVVTSTLQSMIEIADPIVLALGASRNRSFWKHFRGVSMCLFLLVFPCFMAYKIARFFQMDFWLLILVSSCMLTSLQVMGTIFIYTLFMIELAQEAPLERMDEIVYGINAVSRVLEFLVALCVVAYGAWESVFGEWSWMGASVIIIHSYFNVWLRAQSGWRSFLLRREAAQKIRSLPRASGEQLREYNDVCAICFQDMAGAVTTRCGHFFHADCLRKWLYVQDTCPLCHQPVTPPPGREGQEAGEPTPPAQGAAIPEEGVASARTAEPSRTQEQDPAWVGELPQAGEEGDPPTELGTSPREGEWPLPSAPSLADSLGPLPSQARPASPSRERLELQQAPLGSPARPIRDPQHRDPTESPASVPGASTSSASSPEAS